MKFRNIFPLVALLAPFTAVSGAKQITSAAFDVLSNTVNEWNLPAHTLVVSDNDDTLTAMPCPDLSSPRTCQFLGGASWFSWQEKLLETDHHQKVADSFPELLEVSALLFAMNDMVFTQDNVPSVLASLQKNGVKTLVATARGNENISATEQQFTSLKVTKEESLLAHFAANSPKFKDEPMQSPYLNCVNDRAISYRNGVLYLAGQNKGENLKCFIHRYNREQPAARHITHMVFIDDSLGNVEDVTEAFEKSTLEVVSIYYTALKKHKEAFMSGSMAKRYQQKATERWNQINGVLERQLLDPALD
ncbi:DUF2608 domain-containing protein [Alteromonas sp. a30]|uniref:DUF2608 domain-containing protein n=1 Tax=Alteromonas sp. a30 TaxID=2730917 RepID=UPI00227EB0D2|nr:DUF2608 domain-containing protein [Alteromonas sp. a30]MCY7296199.1 DUF2608 domain-containing protein [Alteromonas sp. a30]